MNMSIGLLGSAIAAPFTALKLAPLVAASSSVVTTTGSVLIVFMLAVLYESERARRDPDLYPVAEFSGYGKDEPEPAPAAPYPARPYVAGPYTAGPYLGGPDAAGPYSPAASDPTASGWIKSEDAAPEWRPPRPYIQDPAAPGTSISPPVWPANPLASSKAGSGDTAPDTGPAKDANPPQPPIA
jgi:hypothetical protein